MSYKEGKRKLKKMFQIYQPTNRPIFLYSKDTNQTIFGGPLSKRNQLEIKGIYLQTCIYKDSSTLLVFILRFKRKVKVLVCDNYNDSMKNVQNVFTREIKL